MCIFHSLRQVASMLRSSTGANRPDWRFGVACEEIRKSIGGKRRVEAPRFKGLGV